MEITSITATLGAENFYTRLTDGTHTIIGDEPLDTGGQDQGLDPYELVLAGLALCKAATMRLYAQRKGWDTGDIQVHIDLETAKGQKPKFSSRIHFSGKLSAEQQQRIIAIGDKCPTHRLLEAEKTFETKVEGA
ncbi:MAG TPA: OsmC family protein [Saprospiraceae bacterium]|nr:OsmC family protein [Saprospiraceae bacterium]